MALVPWVPPQERDPPVMDAFRGHIRVVLRARGFTFCDEGAEGAPLELSAAAAAAADATTAAARHEQLITSGTDASSTDAEEQSVANAAVDDDTFWSSTGGPPDAVDHLTFRLAGPLCVVQAVTLAVYRARYQFGEPVYPPCQVSFCTGPSPHALHPAGPPHDVAPSEFPQTFRLPPCAAVGGYLRVVLLGRRQRQLEDLQHYLAVRHVAAYGERLPPTAADAVAQLLRSAHVQLPASSWLPAAALAPLLPPLSRKRRHRTGAAATHAAVRLVLSEEAAAQGGPGQSALRSRLANFLGLFGAANADGGGSGSVGESQQQQQQQQQRQQQQALPSQPHPGADAAGGGAAAAASGVRQSPVATRPACGAAEGAGDGAAAGAAAAASAPQSGRQPLFIWHPPPLPPLDTETSSDEEAGDAASGSETAAEVVAAAEAETSGAAADVDVYVM